MGDKIINIGLILSMLALAYSLGHMFGDKHGYTEGIFASYDLFYQKYYKCDNGLDTSYNADGILYNRYLH